MRNTRVISCSLESVKHHGMLTDPGTFEPLLRQCGESKDLFLGSCLHAHIIESGHDKNVFFANLLVQMYGKCQAVNDAHRLFSVTQHKDVYSWTFMVGAYAQLGRSRDALHIFQQMQRNEVKPNRHTFIYLLSACADRRALFEGRHVHTFILSSGFEDEGTVATAIVCMYSKCGSLNDALHVFNTTREKDTISWNAIISMVSEHGYDKDSQKLFQQMQVEGLLPTKGTFLSFLNAFLDQPVLSKIRRIHTLAVSCDFHLEIAIVNALVTMYGKCSSIKDAHNAFQTMPAQNVISWTAMIGAYAENGQSNEVVQILQRMLFEGFMPDKVTFATSLASCTNAASLLDGLWLHSSICYSGFESDVIVGTALVNMYGKCGSVEDARRIFAKLHKRDVVCWNAIIAVYAQHGHGKEALQLLREMGLADFVPNKITFICILDACANEEALDEGRRLHACLMQYDFESEIVVVNALVNFYGKCGSLVDSERLFDKLPKRSLFSWTSIIAANGQHGWGGKSLLLFEQMRKDGVIPNAVTFVSILSSCSHAGMVQEAWNCILVMRQEFGFTATMEHFDCLVDLLGRAGLLLKGQALIDNMPFQPSANTWMTFLGACKLHNNSRQATYSTLHALEVDSTTAAPYVILSNIHSAVDEEKQEEFVGVTTGEDLREQWNCSLAEAL
eukprot:c16330_g1_i3 orf=1017-3035(-)